MRRHTQTLERAMRAAISLWRMRSSSSARSSRRPASKSSAAEPATPARRRRERRPSGCRMARGQASHHITAPVPDERGVWVVVPLRVVSPAPIIAAGGIMSASDATENFSAGAKLVQIYSACINHGPRLIKQINDCYEPACSYRRG